MSLDIFNLSIDDFQEETSAKSTLYKTDPKDGKDSIYRSVVRFLPNPKNPKNSAMKKLTYWLTDSSGEGAYYDSPKTIDKTAPCVIGDVWWKLSQSSSAADKKSAEKLKRKEYYFSLVQVIKDPQNPELEGTVQIYRYPKTLKKLIDGQIQPSKEDMDMGAIPCNVFDLFEGKDFNIKVTLKGGFWNYDECKFVEKTTPASFNGKTIEKTAESQKAFLEYLNASPDMTKYEYKPWSEEDKAKLMNILNEVDSSNPGKNLNTIAAASINTAPSSKPATSTPAPTAEVTAESLGNDAAPADELEDFLKNL